MRFLRYKLALDDFLPPIFHKITRRILVRGKTSLHPFEMLPRNLQPEWILDVGANQGDVTLAALRSFPLAKVICFEPVKSTFKLLQGNVAAYRDRTLLFNKALSDQTCEASINITTFHGANAISSQTELYSTIHPHITKVGSEHIECVKLDEISATFPTVNIDVMKIDVEGHELNVLRGGRDFICKNVGSIIIEVSLLRDTDSKRQAIVDIFDFMRECGFALVNIFDIASLKELSPINRPMLMIAQMDCIFQNVKDVWQGGTLV